MEEYTRGYNACNRKWRENIKDMIEELKKERTSKYDNYMGHKIESREQQDIDKKIKVLQELIEGEK